MEIELQLTAFLGEGASIDTDKRMTIPAALLPPSISLQSFMTFRNECMSEVLIKLLLKPCEPEMWFALSSVKPAWSCSSTKRYAVPSSDKAAQDKIAIKYRQNPESMENKSFVQWLREVNHNSIQFNSTKVIQIRHYPSGPYFHRCTTRNSFFQETLMNMPHRTLNQLCHVDASLMSDNLKFLASATTLLPGTWNDKAVNSERLEIIGHKNYFIEGFISNVQSLRDLHKLWRLQVFIWAR